VAAGDGPVAFTWARWDARRVEDALPARCVEDALLAR
jgi:hypothetical protein